MSWLRLNAQCGLHCICSNSTFRKYGQYYAIASAIYAGLQNADQYIGQLCLSHAASFSLLNSREEGS